MNRVHLSIRGSPGQSPETVRLTSILTCFFFIFLHFLSYFHIFHPHLSLPLKQPWCDQADDQLGRSGSQVEGEGGKLPVEQDLLPALPLLPHTLSLLEARCWETDPEA